MPDRPQEPLSDSDRLAELAGQVRDRLRSESKKTRRLISNLESDLAKHGDPEVWKRYGDLILANIRSAQRHGDTIRVADHFAEGSPIIDIEGDRQYSLTQIAESYFRRYTKARNGIRMIAERMTAARSKLADLEGRISQLDMAEADQDLPALEKIITDNTAQKRPVISRPPKKADKQFRGARRFLSTDGLEILVGKKAADNDQLTFRIARSLDTWLHAADYPGSHVVIRASGKKAVPDRTLIEAAQLAAFYSDAREQPKASVRYTQRKFVNKIKGGTPGLVRLASFKTLLVEPKVGVQKLDD